MRIQDSTMDLYQLLLPLGHTPPYKASESNMEPSDHRSLRSYLAKNTWCPTSKLFIIINFKTFLVIKLPGYGNKSPSGTRIPFFIARIVIATAKLPPAESPDKIIFFGFIPITLWGHFPLLSKFTIYSWDFINNPVISLPTIIQTCRIHMLWS